MFQRSLIPLTAEDREYAVARMNTNGARPSKAAIAEVRERIRAFNERERLRALNRLPPLPTTIDNRQSPA